MQLKEYKAIDISPWENASAGKQLNARRFRDALLYFDSTVLRDGMRWTCSISIKTTANRGFEFLSVTRKWTNGLRMTIFQQASQVAILQRGVEFQGLRFVRGTRSGLKEFPTAENMQHWIMLSCMHHRNELATLFSTNVRPLNIPHTERISRRIGMPSGVARLCGRRYSLRDELNVV